MQPQLDLRAFRWFTTALACSMLLGTASVVGLVAGAGTPARDALDAASISHARTLAASPLYQDSWFAMLWAYQAKLGAPDRDLYAVLFEDHVKFQYPPSALLVLDLLPRAHTTLRSTDEDEPETRAVMDVVTWPSRLACLWTIACSVLLFERSFARLRPRTRARSLPRMLAAALLGLGYYPLLRGYELGQIQVFLNGLAALALLLMLTGRRLASGVCVGLCCLIKPQYGVLMLLGVLWRDRRFMLGSFASAGAGFAWSVLRFGARDHLSYLSVLRFISRHGEVYWPNQSVNGLLHRFLLAGDPVHFDSGEFAPYRASVYVASTLAAALLLALALWPERRGARDGRHAAYGDTLAMTLVLAAATIGSPVAWEHHYGAFLPIFALGAAGLLVLPPWGRWTGPMLAFSYLLAANALLAPELLFRNRWLGLLGSHLWFAALVLFGLLYSLRRRLDAADAVVAPGATTAVDHGPALKSYPSTREV